MTQKKEATTAATNTLSEKNTNLTKATSAYETAKKATVSAKTTADSKQKTKDEKTTAYETAKNAENKAKEAVSEKEDVVNKKQQAVTDAMLKDKPRELYEHKYQTEKQLKE